MEKRRYKLVFMGTPRFAVPSLKALAEDGRYDIVGVVTQPDRPAGRGKRMTPCPVKQTALEKGLPVFQFERVSSAEGVDQLRALAPDVMITAAFGQILRQAVLEIPPYGTVNVHASLLPRHRGSAPVNWSILAGDERTGVTLMRTDVGLDTGDMLAARSVDIGQTETAGELTERLSHLGAELLAQALPDYLEGRIEPVPQDPEQASYEPMLKKEMGRIDWTLPAAEVARRVRGLDPWPGTFTETPAGVLKVFAAQAMTCEEAAEAGQVIAASAKEGLVLRCGQGALKVLELQAPGGKRMPATAYLSGRRIDIGTVFGRA